MIIRRIRLRNWRQYRGEQDVSLADGDQHNVTVIEGPNGAGKSSLFLALNWCLYGLAGDDKGSLLTKGLDGDEEGFVEVHFRHEGRQYIARRTLERVGGAERYGDLSLDQLKTGAKVETLPDPSQRMNGILPADARRYFFFDGEKIDEMSRPGHEEEVSDAVRSVLKLRVLERAVRHLEKVEKDLAKSAKQQDRVSEREAELIEHVEAHNERIRELKEARDEQARTRTETESRLADLNDRITELAEVKDVARRERELEADLQRLEEQREHVLDAMQRGVAAAGVAIAGEAVDRANTSLDEKRAKGEIPSSIRQSLIDDLLASNRCICDRALDEDSRAALNRRRETSVSSELEEAVQIATGRIKALAETRTESLGELRQALEQRSALIDEEDRIQRELGELRRKLKSDFSETVTDLEEQREGFRDQLRDLDHDIVRYEYEIEAAIRERDKTSKELAQIEATDVEARRARRKYELAAQAADAAQQILEEFRKSARAKIEDATDEVFKSLLWKKQQFERVRISEDYALDVIDRFDRSALKELSAGERQVLSLSFIVGMAHVADEGEAPFVIDTPLGRISEEVRENIAQRLPDLAPQVVLLVTDQELMGDARAQLEPRIGAEYRLDFDDSVGVTTIREVNGG